MAAQDVLKKLLASKMKGANPKAAQALLAKMKGRGGGKPQARGGKPQGKTVPGVVGSKTMPMPKGGLPQGAKIVAPNPSKPTAITPGAAAALKKRKRR